ncbi:MAG TPA: UDP-N-acetylmuramoyl-tripeptide--D-alanyl-D-alanine ligase [Candidatus Baltobacteraceae bacterium]|jgi:UDP-N-acetylmuramoyl-tripeptide--D-alanyl-D-alanine ligase|nr:UDP-N-acetylmuramoyl-tripeptide--D-alanyl-D-alanine ligase [Candidatus Baltobacteraceae bacterium]
MKLTVQHAAKATAGRVFHAARFPEHLTIVTDTRSIRPGDVFLALRGERFDGHAYLAQAVAGGAAAVIIDEPASVIAEVPTLLVADTKRAYMSLAGAVREEFHGQVIGITGSTGKTTTKYLLAQLLAGAYGDENVLASPANENNEIGVSKLLLSASEHHRVLVVEMGARHQGDIAELVRIARPQVGVLTNIGDAHLEIFGSREGLARTKWGLFSLGAQAVLNARDSESALRAASLPAPPLWFGAGEPGPPGVYITQADKLILTHGGSPLELSLDIRLPGAHNRANLAAALAAALLSGVSPEHLARMVPSLALPAGRYETIAIENGTRLIYDAYNANTAGMIAALDAFADEDAERRIAVLASMAEIGADAPAMHERIGAHAASRGVDVLLVSGDFAESVAAGAVAAGLPAERIVTYGENAEAARWLQRHARPRDVVLLKGSRKYKMEEIVSALRSSHTGRAVHGTSA